MKNIMYVASITLMASGMVFAQTTGSQGTMDSQIGSSTASAPQTQATPKSETPGAMGAPATPNDGMAPKGETPATGVQSQPQSPTEDKGARPAMDAAAAPTEDNKVDAGSVSSSADTPSYAKPITPSDSSNSGSTQSQKGTDSGTQSPK